MQLAPGFPCALSRERADEIASLGRKRAAGMRRHVSTSERVFPRHCEERSDEAIHVSASITAPGVITQVGAFMRMVFGELDGKRSQRGEAFLALCQQAGIEGTFSETVLTDLWMKFILLASNAGMMSLARQPIGNLRDDPDMRPIFLAAYREVADVGRAKGVSLPADAVDKIVALTSTMPPPMKASMALDLERGNRLEVPWLSGKVVELGKQYGIPTPTHAMLYAMLKPYAMGGAR